MKQPAADACSHPHPLAYRFRKGVTYHDMGGEKLCLTLPYPLKVIHIHPHWRSALAMLANSAFVPFDELLACIPGARAPAVAQHLNRLVRKGFLEQQGFPTLVSPPLVSVIIPVRNRPRDIAACLQSLCDMDYPGDKLEIIVVDDASQDDTPRVAERFPVHLIRLDRHRHAPHCRNLAARRARGDILAFIDSDCLADPQWLKELLPVFDDPAVAAVGGMVDAFYEEKGLDRYEKVNSSLFMGKRPRRSSAGETSFYVPSCNLLVRREPFVRQGGFRESLVVGEDVDLCYRLQDAGHAIEYRPVGKIYHKHRNLLWAFSKRRFEYGTSEPMLARLHPRRRKEFLVPWGAGGMWVLIVLSIVFQSHVCLASAGLWGAIAVSRRVVQARRMALPVTLAALISAVLRGFFTVGYHCCSFVSRYYLVGLPLLWAISPLAGITLLGAHAITTAVNYGLKAPRLNLASFGLFFTLDQLAYQAGVWWACVWQKCYSPVNPRIVFKVGAGES